MPLSTVEAGILVRALDRAPSVHNTQPWELVVEGDALKLYERPNVRLPRQDPVGRDRLISCGAAVANVRLAARALGRAVDVVILPRPDRPDLVAEFRTVGSADLDDAEVALYAAVFRRRSYRAPFALRTPSHRMLRGLAESAAQAGASIHLVHGRDETKALAGLLSYAGGVLHDDRAYQRELSAWSGRFPNPLDDRSSMPWSSLVRGNTYVPDRTTLYNRLSAEAALVVHTATDTRGDHVLAGSVLQRLWLTAVAHGLVGSVLTQPLLLPEVRLGITGRLHLRGYAQAILRTGYPVSGLPIGSGQAIAYPGDGR